MGLKKALVYAAVLFAGIFAMHLFRPATTFAAINPQINFQGKLANTDGTNVTNGTFSIVFSIYTVSSGGVNIWTETQASVSVTDGIFQVALGSVTTLPGSVDFNTNSLYLGIKVGTDAEMTPRVQFTASPYAFNSDKLGGLASSGYLQLGPSAAQTDASTNSAIFLNKTSSGNLVQLQNTAVDAFTVGNTGNVTLGQNASKTISVAQTSSNAAGQNLTLNAGQGGAGAAANAGGILAIQGGAGGGTNGNGGNLTLAAGALNGSGAVGSVIVKNPSDSITAFQIQNAAGTQIFVSDTSNNRLYVGNVTSDATGVLLVLDDKNTTGDPSGVNGGEYYNSFETRKRCYANGAWNDCLGTPRPNDRRSTNMTYPGSGTVFTLMGDVANVGTAGTAVVSTTTEPGLLQLATGAVNGNVNHVSGNTNYDSDNRIIYQTYMSISVVTVLRVWAGITNQTAVTMTGSANPAGIYAAFRFDTVAGDANFKCITKDNVTQNILDSGIAPAAAVGRKFEIIQTSTDVIFRIDGARVCRSVANLPTTNTLLRYVNTVTTLENVIKTIRVGWIYIESDK